MYKFVTQLFVGDESLSFDDQRIKILRNQLVDSLNDRFDKVETDKHYTFASILDPSNYQIFVYIKIKLL